MKLFCNRGARSRGDFSVSALAAILFIRAFHSLKYDSMPFPGKLCLHPILYTLNTLKKSNQTRNDRGKVRLCCLYFR